MISSSAKNKKKIKFSSILRFEFVEILTRFHPRGIVRDPGKENPISAALKRDRKKWSESSYPISISSPIGGRF